MSGVSAFEIVFFEHLFLIIIFAPFIWSNLGRFWQLSFSQVFGFAVMGVLGSAVATLAFTRAFVLINPSVVILLQKLQPVVAIILAHFILKEKMGTGFLYLVLVAFLGSVILSLSDPLFVFSFTQFFKGYYVGKGYFYSLIAVVGWGSALVFAKKNSAEGLGEKELMAGRYLFGFLAMLGILGYARVPLVVPLTSLWKIAVMVVLSGIIAMYLYYKGVKLLSARVAAIAEMTFPLWAVLANWLIHNQQLNAGQMIGGFLLLLSSTIIQYKKL
jgi:drug/metabolite transporter (DMT)-like permease